MLLPLLASGWVILPAVAQYTASNQTNIISGVISNWPGDYVIGSNTFATALRVLNGGVLLNAQGFLGYTLNSTNNLAVVTGAGSVWSNSSYFYLGYAGSANTLIVSNAGRFETANAIAYIGYDATSDDNRALITGAGSIWNGASICLGSSGSGNSLVVSNGAKVVTGEGMFGSVGSTSNLLVVTGSGTVWSNTGNYLDIGYFGSGNKMVITNGGRVVCRSYSWSYIGQTDTSCSNTVLISDVGSVWDVSGDAMEVYVGGQGSGNNLIVTNGGMLKGYYVTIGERGSNNSALVTGSNTTWTLNCFTYVGRKPNGNNNAITLADGAKAVDKFIYINYDAACSNNSVVVTGTNTSWRNTDNVFVGLSGSRGSLTISNGAWVTNLNAVLGFDATSSRNTAVVTGGGAGWHCVQDMAVGNSGWGNQLAVRDGGRVRCDYSYLGGFASSSNNSAVVAGAGALWTNYHDFYIGDEGGGNSLVISNGGRVADYAGILGLHSTSVDNRAVVTGAGALWTNSAGMFVGYEGANNSLIISNGGLVVNRFGSIGENESSTNNSVRVESGGTWRTAQLCVGNLGSHSALVVDGGSVFTTNLVVGYDTPYCDNLVRLDSGQLIVTNQTGTAVLEVYDGALVVFGGTLRVDKLIVTNACAQFIQIGGTLVCGNLQLNPNYDADADGMRNGWEQANGLNPFYPFDNETDSDGDGVSNLQEYMAGTSPTNKLSCLRITGQTMTGSNVQVNWSAVGGKSYVVQASPTPGGTFTDLSPIITVPGSGETSTNYVHVGAATNWTGRYYRVRLAP